MVYQTSGPIYKDHFDDDQRLVSLAVGVSLLARDPMFAQPILLKRDQGKQFDMEALERAVDRAKQQGRNGFVIGKNLQVSPRIRWPRFAVRWTGNDASVPLLVPAKGCVVHRDRFFPLPTEHLMPPDDSTKPSQHAVEVCKRKRSFFSQHEANVVARKFNQRVYECSVCHCWHTTKSDF